jgi:hypothetical protein
MVPLDTVLVSRSLVAVRDRESSERFCQLGNKSEIRRTILNTEYNNNPGTAVET